MTDKRRKLMLIGALGVVVLFIAGDSVYERFYVLPLKAEDNRKNKLGEDLHKVKLALLRSKQKLEFVSLYRDRSLPSKSEYAISEYHDWLFGLIKESGLKRINLNSSSPSNVKNMFRKITFTVRGSGTLKQITRFLHTFYETGHLHKVRSLSLNPSTAGLINMTVSIEALSLATATSEDKLTAQKANRLAGDSFEFYDLIARRDLFQGNGNDWAKNTKLAAITKDTKGNVQAWFRVGENKAHVLAKFNEETSLGGHQVVVLGRSNPGVEILVDGDAYTMRLGQSFADCFMTDQPTN